MEENGKVEKDAAIFDVIKIVLNGGVDAELAVAAQLPKAGQTLRNGEPAAFEGGVVIRNEGPTRDMSPANTLSNWGSSSRLVLRRNLPAGVIRLSPAVSGERPYFGASMYMLRNLSMTNGLPDCPVRS
jgi:hypothetical protein